MKLARTLAIAAAFVTLAVPALASAQGKAAAKPVEEDGRGYEYRFDDDLMQGGGLDSGSPVIRVSTHALRSQLIRPRTNFVPELLKSAESF